jgi:H+/Cl- antiporter ClcA
MLSRNLLLLMQGTDVSKYALIGAAANLGGATRMTLSLAVIIIECTGDIMFGVPIIVALICAKWIGDLFNPVSSTLLFNLSQEHVFVYSCCLIGTVAWG